MASDLLYINQFPQSPVASLGPVELRAHCLDQNRHIHFGEMSYLSVDKTDVKQSVPPKGTWKLKFTRLQLCVTAWLRDQ